MKTKYGIKLLFTFLVSLLLFQTGPVFASNTEIEIFYLAHRPAVAVVDKIDKIVAEFNDIVTRKYNFEDPASKKLLKKYKLSGHMPVAIYINGKNNFTIDGKKIQFRNFPKGDAFVPTFAGEWNYSDLRTLLTNIGGGK